MKTETKNKKNTKLKGGISGFVALLDVSVVTTLAVWVAGLYLVIQITKLTNLPPEIHLISLLIAMVFVFLMVVTLHQTRIIHILKSMEH